MHEQRREDNALTHNAHHSKNDYPFKRSLPDVFHFNGLN